MAQLNRPKVLIANRSEIACRVFQTCREMGLGTVGVSVSGDEDSRHLTYADEIIQVSSYLDISSIIKAAQTTKSKLIHPGYGFLSERPAFVKAVEKAGLVFIGPSAETMELMGGKISAKEIAAREKVPTLAWAKIPRGQDIKTAAKKVGFPLLLKAAAGGGGKGMRKVLRIEELDAAAESASAEALSAFGDGTLFLEHLIEQARHIEVQIFGQGNGKGVHLYERECSLQRRHQKIWEEAQAPHLNGKTREGLFGASLKLIKAVKYRNAGTIEFLIDEDGKFYFLEMNTRLQVEHPVTEQITGVDLVRAQIEQSLRPKDQVIKETPPTRGHAIEVRLYAEDPYQGFVPTPGRVEKLKWPTGAGIRVESGIEEGQVLGTQFDSMLAKLIVSAESRERALERLKYALEETVILGLGTNQSYLRTLCDHPSVQKGEVYTQFLEKEFTSPGEVPSEKEFDLLDQFVKCNPTLALSSVNSSRGFPHPSPWRELEKSAEFSLRPGGWGISGKGPSRLRVMVRNLKDKINFSLHGRLGFRKILSTSQTRGSIAHQKSDDSNLIAQFPGKVRKILVKEGAKVKEGDTLLMIEAMKMEFAIKSAQDAKVKKILVQEGQSISPGDRYVDMEDLG